MTREMVSVAEELSACPRCGAAKGFHVALERRGRDLAVVLLCPSCGFRFTAGEWLFPSGDPRPFDPSIDSGP